jgi:hypothetical protein
VNMDTTGQESTVDSVGFLAPAVGHVLKRGLECFTRLKMTAFLSKQKQSA